MFVLDAAMVEVSCSVISTETPSRTTRLLADSDAPEKRKSSYVRFGRSDPSGESILISVLVDTYQLELDF